MTIQQWMAFQSGSDIRGFGLGEETNPLYLSNTVVGQAAAAFAGLLGSLCGKPLCEVRVSVGHDPRLSAGRIKAAIVEALSALEVQIVDCGLCSTPAMFFTTRELGCDGAIQITASHHPKDRNGLKFFTKEGGLEHAQITQLLQVAASLPAAKQPPAAANIQAVDFLDTYTAMLREMICTALGCRQADAPLSGKRIAVVAGNGAGGFYATRVLAPLGADITGSLHLSPDGNFPHFVPNPENAAVMQAGCDAVTQAQADFGIVFDTDVDRVACIAPDGTEIARNRLIALCAAIVLREHPGATIVTDSVTSDGLAQFIRAHGGVHLRYKRGYRNVINKQIELCEQGIVCPLAIETSGHAAFSENYFLDDGAFLATKLVIALMQAEKSGTTLWQLLDTLQESAHSLEVRIPILQINFAPIGKAAIEALRQAADAREDWQTAPENHEGIRISTADGWLLLRMSVHDPVLVLNIECDKAQTIAQSAQALLQILSPVADLDVTALQKTAQRRDCVDEAKK